MLRITQLTMTISFDASKDVPQQMLLDRARAEAQKIFDKDSTRRGRSWERVFQTCLEGQAAEVWLMSHHGYLNDTRPYHDVLTPNGVPIEVR